MSNVNSIYKDQEWGNLRTTVVSPHLKDMAIFFRETVKGCERDWEPFLDLILHWVNYMYFGKRYYDAS